MATVWIAWVAGVLRLSESGGSFRLRRIRHSLWPGTYLKACGLNHIGSWGPPR